MVGNFRKDLAEVLALNLGLERRASFVPQSGGKGVLSRKKSKCES